MARSKNALLKGLSGTVGKQFVFKQYRGKTVVSQYPDMSNVKPSELQKEKRSLFAEAVKFARSINNNPKQKAVYLKKAEKGQSAYHCALKEYLDKHKK
jgi:hypothetical protein